MAFTIALIDDEPAIVTALSSLLRSVGYEIRAYASADTFLADCRPAPDCVISDVNMPGTSGAELVRTLQKTNPLIPVILMTAFPSPAAAEEAGHEGTPYLLRKPFEAETLLSRVAEAVRRG